MMAKREEKAALKIPDKVQPFVQQWLAGVVEKTNKNLRDIRRVLEKDVIPLIGNKHLSEVTVTDIPSITDQVEDRGSDQSALLTRNILKRLNSGLQKSVGLD